MPGLLAPSRFDAHVPARIPDQLQTRRPLSGLASPPHSAFPTSHTIIRYLNRSHPWQASHPDLLKFGELPAARLEHLLQIEQQRCLGPTLLGRSRETGIWVHGWGVAPPRLSAIKELPRQASECRAKRDYYKVQHGPYRGLGLPPEGLRKRAQESEGSDREPSLLTLYESNFPNTWPRLITYDLVEPLAGGILEDIAGSAALRTRYGNERTESSLHGQNPVGRSRFAGRMSSVRSRSAPNRPTCRVEDMNKLAGKPGNSLTAGSNHATKALTGGAPSARRWEALCRLGLSGCTSW